MKRLTAHGYDGKMNGEGYQQEGAALPADAVADEEERAAERQDEARRDVERPEGERVDEPAELPEVAKVGGGAGGRGGRADTP